MSMTRAEKNKRSHVSRCINHFRRTTGRLPTDEELSVRYIGCRGSGYRHPNGRMSISWWNVYRPDYLKRKGGD